MKIGILTFHFSNNYGALFQAYGLRNYLRKLGHDVEFINYQPEYLEAGGDININSLFSKATLKIIYLRVVQLKEKFFGNKERENYFTSFKSDFLGVNKTEIYKSKEEIEKANLYYDLLITGSDQVWNPSEQYGIDPVYFLEFKTSNPNVKKISYAPSFGKASIDKKYKNEVSKLISKLDSISVREVSGQNIIEDLTSLKSILVPDPTVLVSNYENVMNKYETEEKNYIFCYYLRSRENIGEVAEYISQKENLQIYSPHNPHRRWKEIGQTVNPGPREWLYLLNTSKFVVTNSFHGTILSILLNKPFVVVGIGGLRAKYNERAMNILKLCGLENRLVNEFNKSNIDDLLLEEIDWNVVNKNIKQLRQSGTDFLKSNLRLDIDAK
ncbi:MAG TPA: polysaccharide pyruvyl transferase family protein [Arcobacter sp.]|nr:polysaccharide pyruvyl transferase family protein [Arcobacter sp.]